MDKIIVIGAGASGLMAAISAVHAGHTNVTLLERGEKIGKKLLVTGNGRCNLTNLNMSASFYSSHDPDAVRQIIEAFSEKDTMRFFEGIGLMLREREGYVYPWCQRATQVVEVLTNEVNRCCVHVLTKTTCTGIRKEGEKWIADTNRGSFDADCIILATGGIAGNAPKESKQMIDNCEKLHHQIFPLFPALVQLKVKENPLKAASGVRTEAGVSLYCGNELCKEDRGELQITDYGISGIPVFQISRYADILKNERKKASVVIDFLPQISENELRKRFLFWSEQNADQPVSHFFAGIFHPKLFQIFAKRGSCPQDIPGSKLTGMQRDKFVRHIKSFSCDIEGTTGFCNAQVCAGGVSLNDIYIPSMESKVAGGLYLCGELLDADGECGGYNLQWAWSTGYLAGLHAAGKGAADDQNITA